MSSEGTVMMNGHEQKAPLAGWVIASYGPVWLIGKPDGSLNYIATGVLDGQKAFRLDPGYQLFSQQGMNPQISGYVTARWVGPLFCSWSRTVIYVPAGGVVEHLEQYEMYEREELAASIRACEAMFLEQRAKRAGIDLAPANVKLPPAPVKS